MIYPLKMVVFHSYVSLPEGINILESAKKSPAFRPFFAWPMIKIHEEMQLPSEKLKHWTMIVAAVSSVGLNMWKKNRIIQNCNVYHFFMIYG